MGKLMNGNTGWRALLVACTIAATSTVAAAQMAGEGTGSISIAAPAPTGPYAVGRRMVAWVDSTRAEPVDSTRRRELVGWVWYPRASGGSEAPREAALPAESQELRIEALRTKLGA